MLRQTFKLLAIWGLLLFSTQLLADVVFTTTPPNPSPANVPLTFSWIDDCEFITIDYGDGFSDTNPATIPNTITHIYELEGIYNVEITDAVCNTFESPDFITVFITGSGTGPGPGIPTPGTTTPTQVNIERLQLYFDNKLPKITVPRNKTDLRVHANIRYSGSGLFQAYWEVDGRIIERIDRHLLDGDSLTLSSPDYIPLPAFITGPHRVRLVVTTPAISPGRIPEAIYFVSQLDEASLKLDLLAPTNNSITPLNQNLDFRWSGVGTSQQYLLEIFESGTNKKIFSAYANQQRYLLKSQIMEQVLQQDGVYEWQVSVLDKGGNKVSVTDRNRFSVSQLARVVDHQFLLIVEDSLSGNSLKQRIIDQYQLDVIEEFPLNSLSQRVTVFQTQLESGLLLNDLKQLNGVIGAQPDFIYRTTAENSSATAEPLEDLQVLSSHLDFDRIHQNMTGIGSRMAIIDSGVDVAHVDLVNAQITTENMFIDENYEAEIHGTAIAGIIAAQKNAFGIIGLAPQTEILALRACRQLQPGSADAECFSSSLAKSLDRAIEQKSKIINFSFGAPVIDPVVGQLLNQGHRQGILLLASAGNDPGQRELSFPASHPNVLSVAGQDGSLLFPNETMTELADILAPSEQIFSTIPDDRHNFLNGTSMSSAIVAGIVSLAIENTDPAELKPELNGHHFCGWVNSMLRSSVCQDTP